MSDTIANLRETLTKELADVDAELARLRADKVELSATIAAKVAERDEIASAVSKLTRKTRGRKTDAAPVFTPVADPA